MTKESLRESIEELSFLYFSPTKSIVSIVSCHFPFYIVRDDVHNPIREYEGLDGKAIAFF